jgi:hypothetical protein
VVSPVGLQAGGVAQRAYVLRRGEVVDERAASAWPGRRDELTALYLNG